MVYVLKKLLNGSPKKIVQSDAIFSHTYAVNQIADGTQGVIRIYIDTKANANVGPFSRSGYSHQAVKACDHDFHPDTVLMPFGVFLPAFDKNHFYFTNSNFTPDFMVNAIEALWPIIKVKFDLHKIAINANKGPENNSRRSQFLKRLFDFAIKNEVSIALIYYPPYH